MASPSELSLDCKPYGYSMLLRSFGDQTDQTHKLEEILSRLEEERLKIDAFKRELPLCMQLLTNAVESSRQQLQASRGNQGGAKPVLEEFIPIKNASSGEAADKTLSISSDKATWMTTAQLWSQAGNAETKPSNTTTNNPLTTTASPKETDVIGFNVSPKLGLDSRQRNGGAFLPFSKERNILCPSPILALSTVDKENVMEDKKCSEGAHENGSSFVKRDQAPIDQHGKGAVIDSNPTDISDGQAGIIVNSNNINGNATTTASTNNSNGGSASNGQTHRKARRCWSPDLHRRFVNALQMLGGSQVATPKQIRELMKVEGLTNDEVKSHLQKYRLHTRRPSPSPQASGAATPQLVVLGSIWVPPEYAAAHGGPPTLYGTHHHAASGSHAGVPPVPVRPTHFCGPPQPVPQDFYTSAAAATQPHHSMHHHSLHQQLHHHVYTAAPQHDHQRSPESNDRGSRGLSESIEDGGKSDQSSSWKGESRDNGRERRGLAALREDGEESNGSEITLKF